VEVSGAAHYLLLDQRDGCSSGGRGGGEGRTGWATTDDEKAWCVRFRYGHEPKGTCSGAAEEVPGSADRALVEMLKSHRGSDARL
jgi:hypothetical protein